MDGDLERFWKSDKELSIDPDWRRRGQHEFARLVSPLDIDGITEQGLRFTISAHIYSPDRWVTFQMEYESLRFPRGVPFVRFEWRPTAPHNNKGIGPPEHRHKPIAETHIHPFELNWDHAENQVRKGNLPIAIPVTQSIETYQEALDFVQSCFKIKGVNALPQPPWTKREWF
jgi:hypothetical protein